MRTFLQAPSLIEYIPLQQGLRRLIGYSGAKTFQSH